MDRDNRDTIINKIVKELAEKYSVRYDSLKPIPGGYQNMVFEFMQNEKPYIFRISDSVTRSREEIEGELEWWQYLSWLEPMA